MEKVPWLLWKMLLGKPRCGAASAPHCSLFPMCMLLWVSLSKPVSVISAVNPRCILAALPFSLFIFRLIFKAMLRFQPVLNETLLMAMCYSCLLCQLNNLCLFTIFVLKRWDMRDLRFLKLHFRGEMTVFALRNWLQTACWFHYAVTEMTVTALDLFAVRLWLSCHRETHVICLD